MCYEEWFERRAAEKTARKTVESKDEADALMQRAKSAPPAEKQERRSEEAPVS